MSVINVLFWPFNGFTWHRKDWFFVLGTSFTMILNTYLDKFQLFEFMWHFEASKTLQTTVKNQHMNQPVLMECTHRHHSVIKSYHEVYPCTDDVIYGCFLTKHLISNNHVQSFQLVNIGASFFQPNLTHLTHMSYFWINISWFTPLQLMTSL